VGRAWGDPAWVIPIASLIPQFIRSPAGTPGPLGERRTHVVVCRTVGANGRTVSGIRSMARRSEPTSRDFESGPGNGKRRLEPGSRSSPGGGSRNGIGYRDPRVRAAAWRREVALRCRTTRRIHESGGGEARGSNGFVRRFWNPGGKEVALLATRFARAYGQGAGHLRRQTKRRAAARPAPEVGCAGGGLRPWPMAFRS